MNDIITSKGSLIRVFCFSILLVFFIQIDASAQVNFINANVLVSSDHATNPSNAIVYDNSYATLNSYGGIAVGIGAYSGRVELGFPSTIPAGKTAYVRIDFDQDVLNALLGGGLGGSLADLLGTVVLGNHYFTITAKNNAVSVASFSSQNNFSTEAGKLIKDINGNFYFAITPNQDYNRIEIVDHTNALLLGTSNSMRVYYAFYTEGTDSCDLAFATSYDGSGGTIDLLGLGAAGVINPEHAIDSDVDSYSHISLGILTLAGTISQTVYFNSLSNPTDQVHITIQLDNPALLNLGLADGLKIEALNGTNVVYTYDIGTILDLDLLGLLSASQKATIPINPGQSFDRVKLTLSSLVELNLTKGLRFYDIYRTPAAPTVALVSENLTVCNSQSVTLYADTAMDNELVWFESESSTTPLAVTAYNEGYITPVLNTTTTYYVATRKIGCPALSTRTPITVTILTTPVAADILIGNPITANCSGVAILIPSTSVANSTFNYYTDQTKTQEITTGFLGHTGITYVKDTTTGTLTINGLNVTNTPMTYYIAIDVSGVCENEVGNLLPVDVTFPSQTDLNISSTLSGCGSVNLGDAIVDFDASGDTTYSFFDSSMNPISASEATVIQASGIYYVQSQHIDDTCASETVEVTVTVHPLPQLVVSPDSFVIAIGDSVTLEATSDATVVWYDSDGNVVGSNIVGPFMSAGIYTYTAVASNAFCSVTQIVTIIVNDMTDCFVYTNRVYAETQTSGSIITGGVFNSSAAVDHDSQTYSTITSGLGVLGIGTTWQTLEWNNPISAGTPVTIKIGTEYSGLALIGAISVVGTKRNGMGVPIDIGILQPLSGSLLDLLPGENCFEYTFVPSNFSGPQIYDGVRIVVGATVSIAQSAKVYEAYYHEVVNPMVCNSGDVEDVFYGVYDLGIGMLTSTTSVVNPWNSVDDSEVTYATMYNGLGALSAADLTVKFRTPSQPTDVLKIMLHKPGTTLNINALAGFTAQRYMGNTPVGDELIADGSLATVELLNGGDDGLVFISNTQSPPFDRVKIRLGGVLNVLDFLQVHYIKREANIEIVGGIDTTIEACQEGTIVLLADDCTTYTWYDAEIGGNVIANGISYTLPNTLTAGTYVYYIQPIRGGCEVLSRTAITVIVNPSSPSEVIADVLINLDNETTFCSTDGNVTLTAELNSIPVVTNPVFYWYSFDGTNQVLIAGENTNTLQLTGLLPGTYTYYVGVSSDSFCQTSPPDRTAITFTILPFSNADDINIDDSQICLGSLAVLLPSSGLVNPQYNWYFTNDITQPIQNGTFGDITYTINANGELTVEGLTVTNSPYTFYVSVISNETCQNLAGTLQAVSIQVIEIGTPTTNDATQNFCASDNPTIASLQVNETGVIWYDAAVNGLALDPTTALVDGATYYAGITDVVSGCSSSSRLEVTVTITTVPIPTTNDATQDFCASDNPTIASLQVNETGVIWYDAAVNGSALDPTTALVDGATYYAGITDTVSGCSSSSRLEVTVTITTVPTPTTNDATQNFCASDNPIIASLQVNETGVIWYDAAVNGSALDPTTALVDGATYYAGITDPISGCSSLTRLAILVNFSENQSATITTNSSDSCVRTPITYTTEAGMSNYVWAVSNGGVIVNGGGINDDFITVEWTFSGNNSISVSYDNSSVCGSSTSTSTLNVVMDICSNLTITKTVDNLTPFVDDNIVFTISVINDGLGDFTNIVVSEPLTSGYSYVSSVASHGSYNQVSGIWDIPLLAANETATLQITVKVLIDGDYTNTVTIISSDPEDPDDGNVASVTTDPSCLIVFNEFTPNEDGSNDHFTIKCVEYYPNNKLEIYNRYGNLVFKTRGYSNDWKGIANVGGTFNGNVLPTGTYYYVFETGESENKIKTGWLFIMR